MKTNTTTEDLQKNKREKTGKYKGVFILDRNAFEKIYSAKKHEIEELVDIIAPPIDGKEIKSHLGLLNEVEIIFSGWGLPTLTKEFLDTVPKLKVIFYGSGSIRPFVTEEFWSRNIIITSAYAANAIPVAQYTLSQIIFSLKRGWYYARKIKRNRHYKPLECSCPGVYHSNVGLVSLGAAGQQVSRYLSNFDVKIMAYDPYVDRKTAEILNVELCSLDDIFIKADVVSLHTPLLEETKGMISGRHILSMKYGSTIINTARGALIKKDELIEALKKRKDITAVLDVTSPEPPEYTSCLYDLENVILTPHIAGAMSNECQQLGNYMVDELKQFLSGNPLKWQITKEKFRYLA